MEASLNFEFWPPYQLCHYGHDMEKSVSQRNKKRKEHKKEIKLI